MCPIPKPLRAQCEYYLLPSTNGNDAIECQKFDARALNIHESINLHFHWLDIKTETLAIAGPGNLHAIAGTGNLHAMKGLTHEL